MSEASNDLIYKTLLDVRSDLGGLAQGLKDTQSHVSSVSSKADAIRNEIILHTKDPEAHGIEAEKRGGKSFIAWVGFAFTALGAILGLSIKLSESAK